MKITISAHEVLFNGSTLPTFARVYCNQPFVNDDNQTVLSGAPDTPNYVKQVSVTNASGVTTIPTFSGGNRIDSSVDVNGATISTYALTLHDSGGRLLTILYPNLRIPYTPTTTSWDDIIAFNQAHPNPPRAEFYDTLQINRFLAELEALIGSGGGLKTLSGDYANDLEQAIDEIGATPTLLIVDEDTEISEPLIVPRTLILDVRGGALLNKTGTGRLLFLGQGLLFTDTQTAVFADFAAGEIQWGGQNYAASVWGSTATASTTNFAGQQDPSSAINGYRNTQDSYNLGNNAWIASGTTTPQWLEVAFGQSRSINRINVFGLLDVLNYSNDPAIDSVSTLYGLDDFKVQYWNGSSWVDLEDVTGNTFAWRQFDFSIVDTTKIRIYVTSMQTVTNVALVEVEAYNVQEDTFPTLISSSLWSDADLSVQVECASRAMIGHQCTVRSYPGTFVSSCTIRAGQHWHLTSGTYYNLFADTNDVQFWVESNSKVYGDGRGLTFIQESSEDHCQRMFNASGLNTPGVDGYNENMEIYDFSVIGQDATVFHDDGQSTINYGNCYNGHIHDITFKDTNAYAAYFAGFSSQGHYADGCSITDILCDNVGGQNVGYNNARNSILKRIQIINFSSEAIGSQFTAVDCEPNAATDIMENITLDSIYIDGRNAVQSWNGIQVTTASSNLGVKGGTISNCYIIGQDFGDDAITSSFLGTGIFLIGANGTEIYNNRIVRANQPAIYLDACRKIIVKDNKLFSVGGGGNGAIHNYDVAECTFEGNIIESPSQSISHSLVIFELTALTGTVNTSGVTVTRVTGTSFLPFWNGLTVRINGVDYTVDNVSAYDTMTLTATAGTQTGVTWTPKFANNQYHRNSGTVNLAFGSTNTSFVDKGTVTINLANVVAGSVSSQTFTLAGAATGDVIHLNPPAAGLTAGLLIQQVFVSAANQITIVAYNPTVGDINEASGTWNYELRR